MSKSNIDKDATRRSRLADVIRGVAIFLMLWGHCIQYCIPDGMDFFDDAMFKFIYSFHMPLLMLVSGYVFLLSSCKYESNKLFIRKMDTLIRSILCGSIFVCLFTTVLFEVVFQKRITGILNGGLLRDLASLWFLWSVLAATLVMCIVVRKERKLIWNVGIIVLGVFAVALFPNAQMNLFMYPYFVIGYYYGKYKERLIRFERAKYLSLLFLPIMLLFFEKKHYIYISGIFGAGYSLVSYLKINSFRWIIGLTGSIFMIVIIEVVLKCRAVSVMIKSIEELGKRSLQIYVLSVVFLSSYLPRGLHILKKVDFVNEIYNTLSANKYVYDFVLTLVFSVGYAFALYWLTRLLEKIKLSKYIFGR